MPQPPLFPPYPYEKHGWMHWHFGAWYFHHHHHLYPTVNIALEAKELAEAVQRRTNYADNASQVQNPDNVLICRYDNKYYVDLVNDALTAVFLNVGKLCKNAPIDFNGDDIHFTIHARWNYDDNVYQSLAHTIQTYIVLFVTKTWLMNRNSEMYQAAEQEFQACRERLFNLVNWRVKVERRTIDPLL